MLSGRDVWHLVRGTVGIRSQKEPVVAKTIQ